MKITDLRALLKGYSAEQLRLLAVETYKLLPKRVREDSAIDDLMRDPRPRPRSTGKKRTEPPPDIEELAEEIGEFLAFAGRQYYIAPNRFVPKKERPKWRFLVKRFVRQLTEAAGDEDALPQAADLLARLYQLLCLASGQWVFNTDDPFRSVGIEQADFLRQVLTLARARLPPDDYVPHALELVTESELDRSTVSTELISVLVEQLPTPALKEMAIAAATRKIAETDREQAAARREARTRKRKAPTFGSRSSDYSARERINRLAETGFRCHLALGETDAAIRYFERHLREPDPEVKLYVLLSRLHELRLKKQWLAAYEEAVKKGVRPREGVRKAYRGMREGGRLSEQLRW
jgi:hypothetical protein